MAKYGFEDAVWSAAKEEVKFILVATAKSKHVIAYSDVTSQLSSLDIEAHDPRFFHLLGEISTEESAAGRGMLSAIVVHKGGDYKPGPGFFELARTLGRDTTDIDQCWIAEINMVYAAWNK